MTIFNFFKKNKSLVNTKGTIASPTNGELIELSMVPDEVFSQKIMGDGFAMKSSDGVILSPVNGTVEMIFDTKHAIGLKSNSGKEILIHLGIDTVNLKGEGFEVLVKAGQSVKVGDKLIQMDVDFIKKNAKSELSPVIFTNLDEDEYISFIPGEVTQIEQNRIFIEKK